ncbi:MAG: 3-sulfinopropanoyl-CoA desulfinase [Pseudomonadota bacterium]
MLDQSRTDYTGLARALAPRFAERAAHWDQARTYCWENVAELAEVGLMGMTIPPRFGGPGASLLDVVLVVEEIAKACTLSARIVVESNMGAISAVMAYGSDMQRDYVAPIVRAGDKPAICITEPDAGSAATEMRTTARRTNGGYVLNGTKHWITGGGVSKLYLVFARVVDEAGADQGITGFLVHYDPGAGLVPQGFRVGRLERTMGICGMPEAEILLDDVFVDDSFVIRPPSGFRHGFGDLMAAYNSQRIGAGTVAMGVASGALDHAKRYLGAREQFGRPLQEFQGLQWMLADMDTKVHASRLMLHEAAGALSPAGLPDMLSAARAKMFAAETAIHVVSDALQMFGARGYGANEPLERMYRDVRMFTIGGGTAQILKTQIAGALLGIKTPQTRDRTPPSASDS